MSDTVYLSLVRKPTDGTTTLWEFSFAGGYLHREYVHASLIDEDADTITPVEFQWIGPNQIQIVPALPAGKILEIYRDTNKVHPLVDYTDGSVLNETNLNRNAIQAIHAIAELSDRSADVDENASVSAALAQVAAEKAEAASQEAESAAIEAQEAAESAKESALGVQVLRSDLSSPAVGPTLIGFHKDQDYPEGTIGEAINDLPTASDLQASIQDHNNSPDAHPALSAFISAEADRAEAAADAASLASGVYPDTETIISGGSGFSPVAEGHFATTPSEHTQGFLDLYRVIGGVAVYVDTYPNSESITWLQTEVNKKLNVYSSPEMGILLAILDSLNRPTFMSARSSDGAPTDFAAKLIGLALGLLRSKTPGYLLALTDINDKMTDLAIRSSDGQFDEFVIRRMAPRIAQYLGLYDQPVSEVPQIEGGSHTITGRDYYERNGELLPMLTNMQMFAGWGSSSMQRSAPYFSSLAAEFGADYYNGGVGGQQTEHISARLGSIPALVTFPSNTIPAGTSPVVVTVDGRGLHFNQDYLGTVGGVHGRLWNNSGTYTFARSVAGVTTQVQEKASFIPDEGSRNRAAVTFLWMGRNDLTSDDRVKSCISNTDTSFDYMAPFVKRTLVLGHFKGDLTPASPTWNRIDTVNEAHKKRLGVLFVDVNAYLISPQVWLDMGITPTQQDLDEQAAGTTPASLRSDGLHLTPAAYQAVVTYCVRARLVELGWVTP